MAAPHGDRSGSVFAVAVLFLVLTWITFSLRAWVRLVIIKNWGIDDYLTAFTLLLFTTFCGWVLYAEHWGTGRHMIDLTPRAARNGMYGWWWAETFYILSTAFLKLAVGAFLLRVASRKIHRWIIYVIMAINVVFNIYYFFQSIFQCTPVNHFWVQAEDPTARGHCRAEMTADSTYAQSAVSILTDWTYGLLPIWIVWNLQMSRQKRFGVAFVLGLGAIASIATIVRVPYVVSLAHTEDFLWSTVEVAIWSTVEPGIGLTVVSLATLRPLLRSCLSRAGLKSSRKSTGYTATRGESVRKRHHRQDLSLRGPTLGTNGIANPYKEQKERSSRSSTLLTDDTKHPNDEWDVEGLYGMHGMHLTQLEPKVFHAPANSYNATPPLDNAITVTTSLEANSTPLPAGVAATPIAEQRRPSPTTPTRARSTPRAAPVIGNDMPLGGHVASDSWGNDLYSGSNNFDFGFLTTPTHARGHDGSSSGASSSGGGGSGHNNWYGRST